MESARPSGVFDWLEDEVTRRRRAGLLRVLRPRVAEEDLLDLSGNDYLGLARHPEVVDAAAAAARTWGAGATGSRLVSGSTELHARLETDLAAFCGAEAALVFSSGYAANLGVLTALAPRGTLIVSDAGNHASLIDGCRLAEGTTDVVAHASPAAVEAALRGRSGRAVVVTDGVFSVDGDVAPLADLAAACRAHGAALVVDDAHGLGVVGEGGRGTVWAAGLAGAPDVVATVTLSKSLGSQGGAVLGPARVIEHLVNAARTFMFDTGLAPAATGAALAALDVLRREPERADQVRAVASGLSLRLAEAGLGATRPGAAVVSVPAPSADEAVAWAARCREAGLAVGCFRPPSVRRPRLRLTARAGLTAAEVAWAAGVVIGTAPTA
ncbi:8-amino-7-oxononanoate synthase [Antribacter gilvus]|uniref:8-amino-7-oxononanoate synthase n=1 Tax=Antribacter gilvus TaxID=2304675 RepID=UPI000F77A186|nr:8-amino-7-oxononanoate synthase [Antribacter gilvus]